MVSQSTPDFLAFDHVFLALTRYEIKKYPSDTRQRTTSSLVGGRIGVMEKNMETWVVVKSNSCNPRIMHGPIKVCIA